MLYYIHIFKHNMGTLSNLYAYSTSNLQPSAEKRIVVGGKRIQYTRGQLNATLYDEGQKVKAVGEHKQSWGSHRGS